MDSKRSNERIFKEKSSKNVKSGVITVMHTWHAVRIRDKNAVLRIQRALYVERLLLHAPRIPVILQMGPPYLPPKSITKPQYTLVLDLDQTLIHGSRGCLKHRLATLTVRMGAKEKILIYARPYLMHFLEELSRLYEIIVYTATTAGLAKQVVEWIYRGGGDTR
eukprot:scpid84845/ scgid16858/ CTD small phosphatase-like protein 2